MSVVRVLRAFTREPIAPLHHTYVNASRCGREQIANPAPPSPRIPLSPLHFPRLAPAGQPAASRNTLDQVLRPLE
jgi:hypothetical protein